MTILIPILGDQLSETLASLRDVDRDAAIVLMMEVREEATYVRHHQKKIALIFSAMRHFAQGLEAAGWRVDYVLLDDPANTHSVTGEVRRAVDRHRPDAIRVVAAGEYRVLQMQEQWSDRTGLPVEILDDDRFVVSLTDFYGWAQGRKEHRMEYFYRDVRRRTGLLMTGDGKPEGGQWNYDKDNRERPPRGLNYPAPERFAPDAITEGVLALVAAEFGDHFGDLLPFGLPVTRDQALRSLAHFVTTALPDFGRYQDAMVAGQDYVFHSALSLCLNLGLLDPIEVCEERRGGDEEQGHKRGRLRRGFGTGS